MLKKKGFDGTTVKEFDEFIKARAVGEGQLELKKNRYDLWLLGDTIKELVPRTFIHGNYSIKLTGAFNEKEWRKKVQMS